MQSQSIVNDIHQANPNRSEACVVRRLMKVMEELGEASEAYLSRTSRANYKNKTWEDYREESVDIMIILVDIALTELPNNYPPFALLPNLINESVKNPIRTFVEMEDRKFAIVKNIAGARRGLQSASQMGFYGAINKAVRAASDMVYARIPGEADADIEQNVYAVVKRKLDKWMTRMAEEKAETI